jgi:hypothetical protein
MPARISFAPTLVTGVCRQPTNDEHWTLYYFEEHAAKCPSCYNPAAVQKSGRQLCEDGRDLACNVAALLFHLRADGHVYANEEEHFVRVEIPAKYEHVAGLFKAVQASRSGILARPRSLDAHFLVRPRIPARQYPVGGHAPAHTAHDLEYDYHHPRAAQHSLPAGYSYPRRSSPRSSSAQFSARGSRESQGSGSSGRWSRGSLYEDDHRHVQARAMREQQVRYSAVPSFRGSYTWG